jgi:hypothetical protein
VSRGNVRAHVQAAHSCREEGDRAGTLDAVRAAHSASRFAVRCLRQARQLSPVVSFPRVGDLVEISLSFDRGPVPARGRVDRVGRDGWVTVDVDGWRELGVSRYIDRPAGEVRVVEVRS